MSEAPANHPTSPEFQEIATPCPGRCVAGSPERPDACGMKEPATNQPAKPKSATAVPPGRLEVQMVLARAKLIGAEAKKIRAVAQLIGMLTGLLYVVLPYVL